MNENTSNKKNTKNNITNTLGYTGMVTVSRYSHGKKFEIARTHNAGGHALFDFLANCLAGDFDIAKMDKPIKIMLLNIDENNNFSVASNSGDFIYLISKPEKVYNVDGGQVRYSFIIPKDIFAGTDFNAIGLYTQSASISDLTDYAAYCKVNIENSGSQGAVLVVDWDLYITNNTRTQ